MYFNWYSFSLLLFVTVALKNKLVFQRSNWVKKNNTGSSYSGSLIYLSSKDHLDFLHYFVLCLLQEYLEEIDKLHRDLQAAREKNGFFVAEENYK